MSYQKHQDRKGLHLIKLSGPLNSEQAEQIRQRFIILAERGIKQVIVDLAEVPFIDSEGLSVLIAGYRSFGSRAQNFRLAALQDQPKLLFELTGFNQIFQLFDHVEQGMVV